MTATLRRKIETRETDGGEVRVERGLGRVVRVLGSPGDPSLRVAIVPEHDGAADLALQPSIAFANRGRPELAAALDDTPVGRRVEYCIETIRRRGIDPALPIAAVLTGDKTRWLTMLRFLPDDDATAPPPARRTTRNRPIPAPPRATGTHVADTWAFTAALGTVLTAAEIVDEQTGGEWIPDAIEWLARAQLVAADFAQFRLTRKIDRNVNSHSRARGAVHATMKLFPPSATWDESELYAWAFGIAGRAAELMVLAERVGASR